MADSEAFDKVCELLEEWTEFSTLESRGTVRIALKQAGLTSASVRPSELAVVVKAVLNGELDSRGVSDADSVCGRICESLSQISDTPSGETPESVFSRLGGAD